MPSSPGSDYVELRCRSAFSFLEGASNPEDLVDRAVELGLPALALADRDGLYGAPRFHQAASRAGLRPLVGAELTLAAPASASAAQPRAQRAAGERSSESPSAAPPRPCTSLDPRRPASAAQPRAQRAAAERSETDRLLLLVESPQGYRNLSRLLTVAQQRAPKGAARATWEDVEAHAAGLTALVRGTGALTRAGLDRARALFPDRLWVDVSRTRERDAEAESRCAVALAEAAGVPVVATGDVRFARPADRCVLDAFTCLAARTSLDRAGRRLLPNGEHALRGPREMAARFADRPAWLRATRAIAERCAFTLRDLGYRFPTFPVPRGESQASWLRRLSFAGAGERYGTPLPPRVRAQLEHELALIEKLGLPGYFLIVHDIARFAREQRILAQGRGSAANSAVCYALAITAVDPVGMQLLFERFLSEERGEWPDIDLDLPSGERRERVIQYVFGKYGPHGAGMTATVISYRARSAVRELGKVLGMAPEVVDRLAKLLSNHHYREDLDELHALLRQAGVDPEAPRIALLLDLVERVKGLPRHLGQHTGGIVIAAGRLDEVVPIEPASMPGRSVVQWDKDDCADLGIIKIDLLGLGMLNALEKTLPLIRAHEGVEIDLAHLPPDDPQTYAMIRRADTVGVFQIESRAQMATLPRLAPRCFYDLVVEIAIIRPGPIVGRMVHPYLDRRAGRLPVRYPHPSLEPILQRTLGVPLFQEQLLRIAMVAAGFSGGEAEELRRAMGFKRSLERMRRIEARLRAGMQQRGIVGEAQQEIVRGIQSFALYGFPESHSASFALIAYASAYLKAHHPAAFLAGLLNAWPMGFYSPATLVKDAQRHGVEVRPIDVTISDWECTLEPAVARSPTASAAQPCAQRGAAERSPGSTASAAQPRAQRGAAERSSTAGPAVRIGLRYVRGLRAATGRALEVERRRAPFASAADLARRIALRRAELDVLAELGALDALVRERPVPPCEAPSAAPPRPHTPPDPRRPASAKRAQRAAGERSQTRRTALWQVAALERDRGSLFAGVAPEAADCPLPEMSPLETTLADYHGSGLTTGPQIMAHLRPALRRRGLLDARQLRALPDGRFVRTAGHVIVRQRPGSAKGFCFLTLEDETGTSNAVLTPDAYQRFRAPLHVSPLLEIAGPLQSREGVVHVGVRELRPIVLDAPLPASHDYR